MSRVGTLEFMARRPSNPSQAAQLRPAQTAPAVCGGIDPTTAFPPSSASSPYPASPPPPSFEIRPVRPAVHQAPEVVRLCTRSAEELTRLRSARQPLYGTAVDCWAVGCIAFELLYGMALFRGEHAAAVERKILSPSPQSFPRVSAALTPVSASAASFISVRHDAASGKEYSKASHALAYLLEAPC